MNKCSDKHMNINIKNNIKIENENMNGKVYSTNGIIIIMKTYDEFKLLSMHTMCCVCQPIYDRDENHIGTRNTIL